jgi:uncharacterized damage-inducible protein DinB
VTLQEITRLVAFNRWANQCFFEALPQLPAEQCRQDMHSNHGGIRGTLAHIIGAERGWLSRWQGGRETGTAAAGQTQSVAELRALCEGVCDERGRFLTTLDDRKLQETLSTTARTGSYTASYSQMIQHVIDHSSYHRGQIVTMLRQLGVTPPSTGLIRFYRDGPASRQPRRPMRHPRTVPLLS